MLASCVWASVAQGIEHWFPEPGAAGSNPAGGTSFRTSKLWEE
jgi:hypothetical protein